MKNKNYLKIGKIIFFIDIAILIVCIGLSFIDIFKDCNGLKTLLDVIIKICIAYLGSFFFYLVITFNKEKSNKEKIQRFYKKELDELVYDLTELFALYNFYLYTIENYKEDYRKAELCTSNFFVYKHVVKYEEHKVEKDFLNIINFRYDINNLSKKIQDEIDEIFNSTLVNKIDIELLSILKELKNSSITPRILTFGTLLITEVCKAANKEYKNVLIEDEKIAKNISKYLNKKYAFIYSYPSLSDIKAFNNGFSEDDKDERCIELKPKKDFTYYCYSLDDELLEALKTELEK